MLAEEQAALRRVATLVARGAPPEDLFAAVTEEVRQVLAVGYASLGRYEPEGAFTVLAWIVASLIFRWYVSSAASFRSAWGSFVAVLVLTAYLYTSAIVFLVGVQTDELIRKDATPGEKGMFKRVRAAFG